MSWLAFKRLSEGLASLGRIALLLGEVFRSLLTQRPNWADVNYQLHFVGVKSQLVVAVTGAFTGMVMCAQTFVQFHKVHMDTATLAVVSVSLSSELGPVLTGLIVAGRVGAAMAAELGTMRVTEQIDALRTLATHPVDYLLVPRLLSSVIALPLLTIESIVIGIGASYLVGVHLLGLDGPYAWANMIHYTQVSHVVSGVIKASVFGGIIALVSCYKGLNCGQGAEGVGKATTEAVVVSSISILVSNFFLTLLLTKLLP